MLINFFCFIINLSQYGVNCPHFRTWVLFPPIFPIYENIRLNLITTTNFLLYVHYDLMPKTVSDLS